MNDFKIKLLALPKNPHIAHFAFFPYGLGVLTDYLRSNGYDVTLDDLEVKIGDHNRKPRFSLNSKINLDILRHEKKIIDYASGRLDDKKIDAFAEQLAELSDCKGYDLVGITVSTYYHLLFALLLCKKIPRIGPKVALGGAYITLYGKELFTQFPLGDYIVVGDGQVPLLKLIEHFRGRASIEDVPNLIYRQNSSIRTNPTKFFPIEDLSMPDFSDLPLDFYRSKLDKRLYLPYHITRGCARNCSFCNR